TPKVPAIPDNLLGHLPYPEAPAKDLVGVTSDGSVKLRSSAAAKYQEMVNAAAASGIYFAPISGFRSLQDQQHVFFDVKAERRQNASKRAEVSAPPGYSEHHTGYAIDIGDGTAPEHNLSPSFENTEAFKWLEANAVAFSFEMSFPKNNRQGVSYEPWHWRFVGDKQSLETFYKAHSMKK
ncbi:D-alanyl-D-alanine carboxypeptidase family protein, partial [Microcoleus sp. HI-ES]|nr:D-alanyl-D-alanine carboxypeptidase family protein [Microcoleus sp. HI-ES]